MTKHMGAKSMPITTMFSTLWIIVMVNVAMADIFGFMMERLAGAQSPEVQIPAAGMLVFAIIMEIPIAMIFLSRVLAYRTNRWANIIASIVTIVFIIAGGSANLVYGFFATVEVLCLALIIWYASRWSEAAG